MVCQSFRISILEMGHTNLTFFGLAVALEDIIGVSIGVAHVLYVPGGAQSYKGIKNVALCRKVIRASFSICLSENCKVVKGKPRVPRSGSVKKSSCKR